MAYEYDIYHLANLILILGLTIFIVHASRRWTLPAQDAKLTLLIKQVDAARHIANAAEESARVAHQSFNYALDGMRSRFDALDERLDSLLVLREGVRVIEERLDQTDQDLEVMRATLASLRCAEAQWHENERPGYCPLHKADCPLNGKKETT